MLEIKDLKSFKLRTVTVGVNLLDRIDSDWETMWGHIKEDLSVVISVFKEAVDAAYEEAVNVHGFPAEFIQTRRVTITPLDLLTRAALRYTKDEGAQIEGIVKTAKVVDDTITEILGSEGVFIGGISSLAHKGLNESNRIFFKAVPEVLKNTKVMNASFNVASFKHGIDLESIMAVSLTIAEIAQADREKSANLTEEDLKPYLPKIEMIKRIYKVDPQPFWSNNARLAVFNDAPTDNPFMAGGFQGPGEPEISVNIGINGAGIIEQAILEIVENEERYVLADVIQNIKNYMAVAYEHAEFFKRLVIQNMRKISKEKLGYEFDIEDKDGIVDLSIAASDDRDNAGVPTNSFARAIEQLGVKFGHHGSLAALALVIDTVKKAGVFKVSYYGGLSGTFIPVSEDAGMAHVVHEGALDFNKYMAMTAVCSVGIDMFPVYWPDSVSKEEFAYHLAGLIADQMAIGVFTGKTTSVRILPVNIEPGRWVYFLGGAGLLGAAPVWDIGIEKRAFAPVKFVTAKGRIPAPIFSLKN